MYSLTLVTLVTLVTIALLYSLPTFVQPLVYKITKIDT